MSAVHGDNVLADCRPEAGHGWVRDADAVGHHCAEEGEGEVGESEGVGERRVEDERRGEER